MENIQWGTSPVRNAFWKTASQCTEAEQDVIIRDMLLSTAKKFTPEEMAEIEQDAPWIEITDDGIKYSRGMVELLRGLNGTG